MKEQDPESLKDLAEILRAVSEELWFESQFVTVMFDEVSKLHRQFRIILAPDQEFLLTIQEIS